MLPAVYEIACPLGDGAYFPGTHRGGAHHWEEPRKKVLALA